MAESPVFVAEVQQLITRYFAEGDEPPVLHVRAPERLDEARFVEPLVEAFACTELFGIRGSGEPPLGSFGPNISPPLHKVLGRRMKKTDGSQQQQALKAVYATVAMGYVGFMSLEVEAKATVLEDAGPPRELWNFAVHNHRSEGVDGLRLAAPFVEGHYGLCERDLVDGLRKADVVGRRTGRLGWVARYHGNFGLYLRAGQTDYEPARRMRTLSPEQGVMPDLWPYKDYVKP